MGASILALSRNILQGILSGPDDLLMSIFVSCFSIPWVCMTRGGIVGCGDVGMAGRLMCSCVKTDWNCSLSACAFSNESVTKEPLC